MATDMEQRTEDERTRAAGVDGQHGVCNSLLELWPPLVQMLKNSSMLQKDAAAKLMVLQSVPVICRCALLHGPEEQGLRLSGAISWLLNKPVLSEAAANDLARQQLVTSPHVHKFMAAAFTALAHEAGRRRRNKTYAWDMQPLMQQQQVSQQQQQVSQQRQRRSGTRAAAAAATGTNSAAAAVNRTDGENTQTDAAQAAAAAAAAAKASGRLIKAPSGAVALKALLQLGCSAKTARAAREMTARTASTKPLIDGLYATAHSLLQAWDAAAGTINTNISASNTVGTAGVHDTSSSSNADAGAQTLASPVSALHFMTRDDAHWLLCVCSQAAQAALVGGLQKRSDLLNLLLNVAQGAAAGGSGGSSVSSSATAGTNGSGSNRAPLNPNDALTALCSVAHGLLTDNPVGETAVAVASGAGLGEMMQAAFRTAARVARAAADNSSSNNTTTTATNNSISRWCTEPPQLQDVAAALLLDIGPVLVDVVTESMSKTGGGENGKNAQRLLEVFAAVTLQMLVPGTYIETPEYMKRVDKISQVVVSAPLTAARVLELALRQCRGVPPAACYSFGSCVSSFILEATRHNDCFRESSANAQTGAPLLPQLATLLLTVIKVLSLEPVGTVDQDYQEACSRAIMGALDVIHVARGVVLMLSQNHADIPDMSYNMYMYLLVELRALLLLGHMLQSSDGEVQLKPILGHQLRTVHLCMADVHGGLEFVCSGACLLPSVRATDPAGGGSGSNDSSNSSNNNRASTLTAAGSAYKELHPALARMQTGVALSAQQVKELGQLSEAFALPALALLPSPLCCNNPACVNLEETAEWQLVNRPGSVCAGCRTARYCSTACQRAHWAAHKPVCKALQEALAGGGYEPPPGYVGVSRVVKL
jgi:MYND finger